MSFRINEYDNFVRMLTQFVEDGEVIHSCIALHGRACSTLIQV